MTNGDRQSRLLARIALWTGWPRQPTISGWVAATLLVFVGGVAWIAGNAADTKSISRPLIIISVAGTGLAMLLLGWAPIIRREWPFLFRASRILSPALVWGFAWPLTVIDWILARPIALIAGAKLSNIFARYGILVAQMVAACALGYFLSPVWAGLSLAWGGLVIFGVWRRWSWIEQDRETFLVRPDAYDENSKPRFLVGFGQDLRDEALTALIFLLIIIPLGLRQFDQANPNWFQHGPIHFGDWILYMGGELAKAVPFVDWSEVYGVENSTPIKMAHPQAEHLTFAMRALFDLLLLAAIVQAAQISGRLGLLRRRLMAKEIDLADPFLEREIFRNRGPSGMSDLDHYLTYRLEQILVGNGGPPHADERLRACAAAALGFKGDESTVPKLLEFLKQLDKQHKPGDDGNLLAEVCLALGRIGNHQSTPHIISIFRTELPDISRRAATTALAFLVDNRAETPLINAFSNDNYIPLRVRAAQGLGFIGSTSSSTDLIATMNSKIENNSEYLITTFKESILYALSFIGTKEAIETILNHTEFLQDNLKKRSFMPSEWALVALGRSRNTDSMKVIELFLSHQNAYTRYTASYAMICLGDFKQIGTLLEAANNPNDNSRAQAVFRLALLCWNEDPQLWGRLLVDKDSAVRRHARFAERFRKHWESKLGTSKLSPLLNKP